jgi:hypothetical protein
MGSRAPFQCRVPPDFLLEGPFGISHDVAGHRLGPFGVDAFRLIQQRELLGLYLRHELKLIALHLAHGKSVGNHASHPGHHHDTWFHGSSDHAGYQPEVRRQPVVEPVDNVSQEPPGCCAVPWLSLSSGQLAQGAGVLGGFLRERQGCVPCWSGGAFTVEGEISLDLLALLPQQQGQQRRGPEPAGEATEYFGPE